MPKTLDVNAVARAITAAGGYRKLARQLGVSLQAVQNWRKQGFMPYGRAVEVEAQYGIDRALLVSPKILEQSRGLSTPFEGE